LQTQTFFTANRTLVITGAQIVWATAFGGGITIDVTKDTSTTAAGGGTSILASAIDATAAINTVVSPALAASAATLRMNANDSLAIKYSATTTGTGVVLAITFLPVYDWQQITFQVGPTAQQAVTQYFFTADRDYEVVDARCKFGVAAGGSQVMKVTIDTSTTAPGSGIPIDATGFNLNATANTVQLGNSSTVYLAATQLGNGSTTSRILTAGDRLGLTFSAGAQSSQTLALTVALEPR
jgi:hypothetical protein